jgi:hypothetical protein
MSRKHLLYLIFSLLALGIAAWPILTSASVRSSGIPVQDADGVFETDAFQEPSLGALTQLPATYWGTQSSDGILYASLVYPAQLLGDITPPQIFNVSIEPSTGLVEWETNEFAASEVRYGSLPGSYTGVVSSTAWVIDHQMLLPDMTGDTDLLLLRSADRNGNVGEYYQPGYSISGTAVDRDGGPIPEVVIAVGFTQVALTGEDGQYALQGVRLGSCVLTPNHHQYDFTPTSISLVVVGNLTEQNFVGTLRRPGKIYLPLVLYGR